MYSFGRYIIGFCLLFNVLSTGYAMADSGLRHVRVIWQNNPAEEAIISWTHDELDRSSVVYFDEVNHGDNINAYRFRQQVNYAQGYSSGDSYSYHALLVGLKPSTAYYFVVDSGGSRSPARFFITAPNDEREFKLLFGGDSRTERSSRQAMNKRMLALLEADPKILALVHGGDYVTNGGSWDQWNTWLEDHAAIVTQNGRLLPIVPARGNHEINAKLFNELFHWPGNGNVYYVTRIAKFTIVHLNTEISTSGDQKDWLDKTLEELSKSAHWIVANYHRPAWPAVKLPSGAFHDWVPLFEKYLADLVFESDGHTLKKTVPIRSQTRDDTYGVVYVGEGGLGVKQRSPKHSDAWYLQAPGYATSAHHVQKVTVKPEELIYEVILKDGSQFERFTLLRRERDKSSEDKPDFDYPIKIFNTAKNSCLTFNDEFKEDVAVHDDCANNPQEQFTFEKVHAEPYYRIKHTHTNTCLTFSDHWLFWDFEKVMFKPCKNDNRRQWVSLEKADFVDWQIFDYKKERCLHFSGTFRNSDNELQAYHKKCGEYEEKERFRLKETSH